MKPVLIKAQDTNWVKEEDVIIGTKWWELVIDSVPYFVLWEFRQSQPLEVSDGLITDVGDDHNWTNEDNINNSEDTVLFKVLHLPKSIFEFGIRARGNGNGNFNESLITITARMQ